MNKRLLILMTLICLKFIGAIAQERAKPADNAQLLVDLTEKMTSLRLHLSEERPSFPDTVYTNVKSGLNKIDGMIDRINLCPNYDQPTADIYKSLHVKIVNYIDLIGYAATTTNADSLNAMVRFVADDMALLYSGHFGAQTNNQLGLTVIKVRVLASDGKTELPGYEPFIKPSWSLNPDQTQPVNPTNNAVLRLLPGKKHILVRKNGRQIFERTVDIYFDHNEPIDFVVSQ